MNLKERNLNSKDADATRRERIEIPRVLYSELMKHAKSCLPNEACGLISGFENKCMTFWPMKNIEPSPYSFAMDELEQEFVFDQMKNKKERFLAIYHSHPYGNALPSRDDIRYAEYSEVYYLIAAVEKETEDLKCYRIRNQKVTRVKIQLS